MNRTILTHTALLIAALTAMSCTRTHTTASTTVPAPTGQPLTNSQGKLINPNIHIPRAVPQGADLTYNQATIGEKVVALTFDDGPHGKHTPRLLDILKQRNINATFFVLGSCVANNPQVLRRTVAEGHEIGNHSWSHRQFTKLSMPQVRNEIERTRNAVYKASGIYPQTMRPPYGSTNTNIKNALRQNYGYPTIMWNVDPLDWKYRNAESVTNRILANTKPGSIILAHDIHKTTIDAMPEVLDTLLKRGYTFVTVSQLIGIELAERSRNKMQYQSAANDDTPTNGSIETLEDTPAPAFLDDNEFDIDTKTKDMTIAAISTGNS